MSHSVLLGLTGGPPVHVTLPREPAWFAIVEVALHRTGATTRPEGPSAPQLLRYGILVRDAQLAAEARTQPSADPIQVAAGVPEPARHALRCPACNRSATAVFAAREDADASSLHAGACLCASCYDARAETGGG